MWPTLAGCWANFTASVCNRLGSSCMWY